MTKPTKFGQTIKTLRSAKGWSLRGMENASGGVLRSGYISQLETGTVEQPEVLSLRRLSTLFEVPFVSFALEAGVLIPEDLEAGFFAQLNPVETIAVELFGQCSSDQQIALIGLMRTMSAPNPVQ